MPELTRSEQDYLKALYVLAPGGEAVATSRLAEQLALSAPSVTNMLGKLAEARLVVHAPRAGARLTARGRRRALEMVRRHRILETFLVRGARVRIRKLRPLDDVFELEVSSRRLVTGSEGLEGVMVEARRGARRNGARRDGKLRDRKLRRIPRRKGRAA